MMAPPFLIHRITRIWTLEKKNGCLADPNYFELEHSFLYDDINNMPKSPDEFLSDKACRLSTRSADRTAENRIVRTV
jgi:hypothetical protein